jgi:hypothetical protein
MGIELHRGGGSGALYFPMKGPHCAVLWSSLKGKREVSPLNEKCDYKVAAAQNSHSPPQIERLDKLNYLIL